jgi:hypothetical protein
MTKKWKPGDPGFPWGRSSWRPVLKSIGKVGEPYPEWLRALEGKTGVYMIAEGDRIVYIGESHRGHLYGTITRHFQKWSRDKKHFAGQYVESENDPGLTYDRDRCRVAVYTFVRSGEAAIALQDRAIAYYEPRDNVQGKLPF